MVEHPFPPLFSENSKILILGSFPSVKSREQKFFYGHPQNRFWPNLARLLGEEAPKTIDEKKALALSHGIALWDVIASCEIVGSADASIGQVTPNDLSPILASGTVKKIFCNGKTSYDLYRRYLEDKTGIKAVLLPSTSPANAAWSKDRLFEAWSVIIPYIF